MRLVLLCSSLEPGRDGVGDYSRRLAQELGKQGHECALVALNDQHLPPGEQELTQQAGLQVLRLSAGLSWGRRMTRARLFLKEYQTDWVSLQFVPYGFHRRGFCFGLGSRLLSITRGSRRHVFFHELSVGLGMDESLNHRAQGYIQQVAIRRLLRKWKPDCVHTHVPAYQAILAKWGTHADLLPLPGNIPLAKAGLVSLEFDVWVEKRRNHPGKYLLGGYFGCFYPNAAEPEFVAGLSKLAEARDAEIICFLAGRQTSDALGRWRSLEAGADTRVSWMFLGEMPPEAVSRYLQELDFGIAATPWELVSKSGSTAAMLDHGLPVLVPRDDFHSRAPSAGNPAGSRLLVRASAHMPWTQGGWLSFRQHPVDRSSVVAEKLLSHLIASSR